MATVRASTTWRKNTTRKMAPRGPGLVGEAKRACANERKTPWRASRRHTCEGSGVVPADVAVGRRRRRLDDGGRAGRCGPAPGADPARGPGTSAPGRGRRPSRPSLALARTHSPDRPAYEALEIDVAGREEARARACRRPAAAADPAERDERGREALWARERAPRPVACAAVRAVADERRSRRLVWEHLVRLRSTPRIRSGPCA
jgi:hypothetical protein